MANHIGKIVSARGPVVDVMFDNNQDLQKSTRRSKSITMAKN